MTYDLDEVERIERELENDAQEFIPEEPEDAKSQELPKKPKPEEIYAAFFSLRFDLAQAIGNLRLAVEEHEAEIAKLKGHRHDTTKAYSGRPEL